jgi:hypothetical protein
MNGQRTITVSVVRMGDERSVRVVTILKGAHPIAIGVISDNRRRGIVVVAVVGAWNAIGVAIISGGNAGITIIAVD